MKKLIAIAMIALNSLCVFGQNKYTVSLHNDDANKNTLNLLDGSVKTHDRHINNNVISFSTVQNYTTSYIDSIFRSYGVVPFSVDYEKAELLYSEKAGGNNCEQAQILCNNQSFNANSGGPGTPELNTVNHGCLGVEHQSSWYYVNIQTGGSLTMLIDPVNDDDDYDFAIWGPYTSVNVGANCPPIEPPKRCSYTQHPKVMGCGTNISNTGLQIGEIITSTGACPNEPYLAPLNVTAGQIYIILVDNYSNSGQPYNMSFGTGTGSAILGCTPVNLPIELTSFVGINKNNENVLSWVTASENNNDYFTLDRSVNGTEWTPIHKEDGAGNSTQELNYIYIDRDYTNTINYYRLSQVDLNGDKEVFKIISVDNRMDQIEVIRTINVMGQDVDEYYKGIVILYYADGTYQKAYRN